MSDVYETREFDNGYRAEIYWDYDAENPRDMQDCLGVFIACDHNKYRIGDKQLGYGEDVVEYLDEVIEDNPGTVFLPVYMYEHSGICFNTAGYSCPWDSGQIGFVYATPDRIKEFMGENVTKERVEKMLEFEIEEYSQWSSGDVYGVAIFDYDGEMVDSLYGCYGYSRLDEFIEGNSLIPNHCTPKQLFDIHFEDDSETISPDSPSKGLFVHHFAA